MSSNRVIRLPEVMKLTGLGKTSIYRLLAEKRFPAQKKIPGVRAATWSAAEVEAYLAKIAK